MNNAIASEPKLDPVAEWSKADQIAKLGGISYRGAINRVHNIPSPQPGPLRR